MRIGIDWRPTFSSRGGIPVYVRRLSRALAGLYPDDRFLLYGHQLRRRGNVEDGEPRAQNLRVVASRLPSRAAEVLSRFHVGADVLVGGCEVFHLTDYAWLRPTRAPLVATIHDVLFEDLPRAYTARMRRGLGAVTRRVVRHATRIIVPAVRTKIALVERFDARPEAIDVVPLAPRGFVEAAPFRGPRPYVLAVGTLEPRKNFARLIEAHGRALAKGADLDLVVAGARGWLDDDLVTALAAAPRVHWYGAVDDATLSALYRGAVALAYPSLGEGFGLPVVEALSLGVPVLTSAGTTCADVAGDAAMLVDPYDVEAMGEGLLRLASDAALRAALVERGRVRAASLTWERTAAGTRDVYARAVG